jgi:hypothetical protein
MLCTFNMIWHFRNVLFVCWGVVCKCYVHSIWFDTLGMFCWLGVCKCYVHSIWFDTLGMFCLFVGGVCKCYVHSIWFDTLGMFCLLSIICGLCVFCRVCRLSSCWIQFWKSSTSDFSDWYVSLLWDVGFVMQCFIIILLFSTYLLQICSLVCPIIHI